MEEKGHICTSDWASTLDFLSRRALWTDFLVDEAEDRQRRKGMLYSFTKTHPSKPHLHPLLISFPSMASIPTVSPSLPTISPHSSSYSSSNHHLYSTPTLPLTSLFRIRITLRRATSSIRSLPIKNCRAISNTESFGPPTPKPLPDAPEKTPKWSARALKAYAMAECETVKFLYPGTGTEMLLLGILVEGTSKTAKFLRANGITLFKVRDETIELLGRSEWSTCCPEHPPLTAQARKALDQAIEEKLKSGGGGEINVACLLLGIWSQENSAGHKILAALGFNNEKAKEVAKMIDEADFSFQRQA
ncbi:hypothetical protein VNO77_33436 [Canavalia gladiata]|uniref:Clp R domain-containing protein n=1 Tax=Canavalia gladiata TaxID=3824 RepID=A0AAN9KEC7_CANGL